MDRLLNTTDDTASISIAAAVAALAFPPVTVAMVPASWATGAGVAPQFDLDIWSTGTLTLTAAELFAGRLRARTVTTTAITSVANATEVLTLVAHGLLTGDGPLRLTNAGGGLPAGLATGVDYWAIRLDADTFKLAASLADALAATPVVVGFTTDGTGTHSFVGGATCSRVYFHSAGLLTASISLTNQRAYTRRCKHRPGAICYALTGTLSTGTLSSAITPVVER